MTPSDATPAAIASAYPATCTHDCCDECYDGITKLMNDMWAYTDSATGLQLAVVGATDRTVIVDVTDGTNPVLIGFVPQLAVDTVDIWKDIKVYKDFAFICSEATGFGIQYVSLRKVASQRQIDIQAVAEETESAGTASVATKTYHLYQPDGKLTDVSTAHNLVINSDAPVLYIASSSRCAGLARVPFVYDSASGPQFALGAVRNAPCKSGQNSYEVHDAQCIVYDGPDTRYVGHEVCFMLTGEGRSLAIYSWTTGTLLSEVTYPGAVYSHQGWLSIDRTHFFLGDELDDGQTRTMIFNVTSLRDPHSLAPYVSAHRFVDHNM